MNGSNVNQVPVSSRNTMGLLIASIIVTLAWLSITRISLNPESFAVPKFLMSSFVMLLMGCTVIWIYHRSQQSIPFSWILSSAVILNVISISGYPLFEDDHYRYLWDGYQMAETGDPFSAAPSHFFDTEEVPDNFEEILSLINYPDIATVYGPVCQWIFALGYTLAPAQIWPLQALAAIAVIALLLILRWLGAGNFLLLFAWSPLILKEFSLTTHPDIFAIVAVFLSIALTFKARFRGAPLLGAVVLAMGCGIKVFAVLALPFLIVAAGSIRGAVNMLTMFFVTIAVITGFHGDLSIWYPEGLSAMADSWLFNAPIYLLLVNFMPFDTAKLLLLGFFMIVASGLLLHWWRTLNTTNTVSTNTTPLCFRGDVLYGLFIMCLPVVNPWYVSWFVAFAVLFPSVWAWALSFSVLLAYHYGVYIDEPGNLHEQPSVAVMTIEYGLVALAVLISFCVRGRGGVNRVTAQS